jgi:hypothetical protein
MVVGILDEKQRIIERNRENECSTKVSVSAD